MEKFVYLNNAATSWPKPPEVLEEVTRCLASPVHEPGRTTGFGTLNYPSAARETLGDFFKTNLYENFLFTANATDAMNILIHGFAKKEKNPFHAITTDLDHNSVLRPLTSLEREEKISLSILPSREGKISLSSLKDAIRPETRLCVISHGSNVLGSMQDIEPIAEYLSSNEIFLILDGAQTAGHIPVNLGDIPLGGFVFTGHKALYGIPGIGGFFLADPDKIAVTRQGGTGTDSKKLLQPVTMPERFETGTPNYPGIASLYAGIRFISKTGIGVIHQKEMEITRHFLDTLKKIPGIIIYNDTPELPVVAFNIRGIGNDDAGYILSKAYGIITRTGLHCAPLVHDRIDNGTGCIRASFSWFNTLEECDYAVGAIRVIAENADSQIGPDQSLR